jgi:hypothetical protein
MFTIINNRLPFTLLAALVISTVALAQTNKPVTDYLNVPGPILFENKSFNLNWSSHPAANFYKQEYIVKGDLTEKYTSMILIDVITDQENIKDVVSAKITELKKMKETNPVINYEVINNPTTGEYMIDFLLTANSPDGKSISIVERNIYRYKLITGKSGQKNILLFGVSSRGYGTGVDKFFASLKANRKDLINKVAQFKMPEIAVKN